MSACQQVQCLQTSGWWRLCCQGHGRAACCAACSQNLLLRCTITAAWPADTRPAPCCPQAAKELVADLQKQAQELHSQLAAAQTVRQEAVEAQMASDSRRDVAETRLLRVQEQLVKANDASSVMEAELSELKKTVQVGCLCAGGLLVCRWAACVQVGCLCAGVLW